MKCEKDIIDEVRFDNKSDTLSKDKEIIVVVKHCLEDNNLHAKDLNSVEENSAIHINDCEFKLENNLATGNVTCEQKTKLKNFEPQFYGK